MTLRLTVPVALFTAAAVGQCPLAWQVGFGAAGVSSGVDALLEWDPDGAGPQPAVLVVGGDFTSAGGVVVHGIAAWLPNGTWAPLGGGLVSGGNAWVNALAVAANGDLLASVYSYSGATTVSTLQRWNGTTWSTVAPALNHRVEALAVLPNGDVVAAGGFTAAGGVPAAYVARWDGSQWHAMGSGMDAWVYALQTLPNGDVIAAGGFSMAGGVAADHIARWNGAAWSPLGGGLDGWGMSLALLPNGDLAVGGSFTAAGGVPASRVARWTGAAWAALGAGTDNSVSGLAVQPSGDLVAAGIFTTAGGVAVDGCARWNGSSWAPLATIPAPRSAWGDVAALPNGDVVVGHVWAGDPHIALWNGSGWDLMAAGSSGLSGAQQAVLSALELPNGDLVIGGRFAQIGGIQASGIARWDGTGFAPLGTGMTSTGPNGLLTGHVNALARLPNGDLVAGGAFDMAGGVVAYNIARWDGTGWSPMGVGMSGVVRDLAVLPNGELLATGNFVWAGGVMVNYVARWDGTGWHALGSGLVGWSYPGGEALAVLPNGEAVVGGSFHTAGGVPAWNIARWDGAAFLPLGSGTPNDVAALTVRADGRLVVALDPVTSSGTQLWQWDGTSLLQVATTPSAFVYSLAELPGGDLAVGGRNFGLPSWTYLTRWNGSAWTQLGPGTTWADQTGIQVLEMLRDGRLLVGGSFTNDSSTHSENLGMLVPGCLPAATTVPTGCVGPAGPLRLVADDLPWLGTTFHSTVRGLQPGAIAVSLFGLTSPNVPWTWLTPAALPGCVQLSSHEAIRLFLPGGATRSAQLTIPADPAFVGFVLQHQFLQFALTAQGTVSSLSSSNGLRLAIGTF